MVSSPRPAPTVTWDLAKFTKKTLENKHEIYKRNRENGLETYKKITKMDSEI